MDCSLPKLKTISVNYRVNYCQFEVNFCFWLIRMQHAALVTQNKMDFFVKQKYGLRPTKIYKNHRNCIERQRRQL